MSISINNHADFCSVSEHISFHLLGSFTVDQSQRMLFFLSYIHPRNPQVTDLLFSSLEEKNLCNFVLIIYLKHTQLLFVKFHKSIRVPQSIHMLIFKKRKKENIHFPGYIRVSCIKMITKLKIRTNHFKHLINENIFY